VKLHSKIDSLTEPVDSLFHFTIPEAHRQRLLHGLDAIGETLLHDEAITRHEQHLPTWVTTANLDLDRRDM
jgi:3-isopropylmalate dehydratase small subunit